MCLFSKNYNMYYNKKGKEGVALSKLATPKYLQENKQNVHRQLQPLDVASLSLSLRSSLEQSKGEEGIALRREPF